jgi:hypothetical protein
MPVYTLPDDDRTTAWHNRTAALCGFALLSFGFIAFKFISETHSSSFLLLYEDYVWVSLRNAMKAKQSKVKPT